MGFAQYTSYDGLGLADLVRRGEVTAAELVDAAIELIERHNPTLNAVVHEAFDEARRAASGELSRGAFTGVPFLIKDLGCPVAGMPRTSGSRFTQHEVPERDGELTRRYRQSGVVLLGKTNTPEFGITGTTESALLGPCRNPWNPDHISGGSSGGAAAAVASGMVPLAHASDGLGSIRIPAACCGLFGLKVTRDRNPCGPDGGADRAIGFSVDNANLDIVTVSQGSVRYTAVELTVASVGLIGVPGITLLATNLNAQLNQVTGSAQKLDWDNLTLTGGVLPALTVDVGVDLSASATIQLDVVGVFTVTGSLGFKKDGLE
ncbi:MAG: hypothetical protein IH804_06900, partial [Planctomycetes bacterium]|nr:hypothetical protein [Planctomycetota bacterium]